VRPTIGNGGNCQAVPANACDGQSIHRQITASQQLNHSLAARHTAPAEGCAEPSQAGALVDPDRLAAIMAIMRPFGNCTAATVSNYLGTGMGGRGEEADAPVAGRGGLAAADRRSRDGPSADSR
jgi:hypothetical protein